MTRSVPSSPATVTLTNAQATKESTINKATAENHTKVAGATSSVSEFMASVEANNTNKDSYQYYKYLNDPNTQINNLFQLVQKTNNPNTSMVQE